jgi:two-component system, chemotaxis family, CheB/CheR fusion protein
VSDDGPASAKSARDDELAALLAYLHRSRGFDFHGYKRTSLERRIGKRMAAVGVERYADYQDHLEVHPDEFSELFDTILINVTGFFRDRPAWDYIRDEVVPALLEAIPDGQPLRVWSAACSSGEEAYTIAMLLADVMGEDAFRERVKIYATDIDEDALTRARQAVYSRDAVKSVPRELLDRFFEQNGSGWSFRTDLRRSLIFGRNDLVQDAPISRVDLLVSRNALMYFTPETQARILHHFNFALRESGFLFLGKSEMLITHSELFKPHSLKWRVFRKVPRLGLRDRLAFLPNGIRLQEEAGDRYIQLREGAADVSPVAQIVVDRNGFVAGINHAARALFSIGTADVGRPLQDLEVSYRPAEVRGAVERSYAERRVVELGTVNHRHAGEDRVIDVRVDPLLDAAGQPMGAAITFEDVTVHAHIAEQQSESKRQLEAAYEELQSTIEELETTNEELQSTNEELETTNEELQSTNEELETMNEELQSTNDELETMNDEQRDRATELDRLNIFLEGILGSLGIGVVVLDRDQRVQVWNSSATDMWGLRDEEVQGEHFLSLDIGLPVDGLRDAIRGALGPDATSSEVTIDAVNRRGRAFRCSVRTLAVRAAAGEVYGAILLMADGEERAEPAHAASDGG